MFDFEVVETLEDLIFQLLCTQQISLLFKEYLYLSDNADYYIYYLYHHSNG